LISLSFLLIFVIYPQAYPLPRLTTSMQGYADLEPPAHPIQHIAVIAPPALIAALAKEASKRGIILEDANVILPPTRQYDEPTIRKAMSTHGVDGVLVVNVIGDTGVQQRYAGTIANTSYSGTSSYSGTTSGNAMVMGNMIYGSSMTHGTGVSSGTATTTSTPVYHYSRAVAFEARLSDPQTSRKFWVGGGQTKAGDRCLWATVPAPLMPPPQFSTIFTPKA
jgi:hypothetical protein